MYGIHFAPDADVLALFARGWRAYFDADAQPGRPRDPAREVWKRDLARALIWVNIGDRAPAAGIW